RSGDLRQKDGLRAARRVCGHSAYGGHRLHQAAQTPGPGRGVVRDGRDLLSAVEPLRPRADDPPDVDPAIAVLAWGQSKPAQSVVRGGEVAPVCLTLLSSSSPKHRLP